jgi:hypothetical protein
MGRGKIAAAASSNENTYAREREEGDGEVLSYCSCGQVHKGQLKASGRICLPPKWEAVVERIKLPIAKLPRVKLSN